MLRYWNTSRRSTVVGIVVSRVCKRRLNESEWYAPPAQCAFLRRLQTRRPRGREPIREPIRGIRRSNARGSLRARKWIALNRAKVSRDEGDAGGDEGGAYVFVGGDGDDEVFVLSGGTKAAVELVAAFDAAVGAHAAQVKASSNRFSMSRAGIPNFLRRRSGQGNLRRPS